MPARVRAGRRAAGKEAMERRVATKRREIADLNRQVGFLKIMLFGGRPPSRVEWTAWKAFVQVHLHAAACQSLGRGTRSATEASSAAQDGWLDWHRCANKQRHEVGRWVAEHHQNTADRFQGDCELYQEGQWSCLPELPPDLHRDENYLPELLPVAAESAAAAWGMLPFQPAARERRKAEKARMRLLAISCESWAASA